SLASQNCKAFLFNQVIGNCNRLVEPGAEAVSTRMPLTWVVGSHSHPPVISATPGSLKEARPSEPRSNVTALPFQDPMGAAALSCAFTEPAPQPPSAPQTTTANQPLNAIPFI